LSLFTRTGDGGVNGRRVALMVADDVDGDDLRGLAAELLAAGVVTRFIGSRLGTVSAGSGEPIEVDATFENSPAVLFDAVVVPGGSKATTRLAADGKAVEFVRDQYRHCKPMLILGDASALLTLAGITDKLASGKADPGLVKGTSGKAAAQAAPFLAALAKHRHFERETEPPVV
jgi:catalase